MSQLDPKTSTLAVRGSEVSAATIEEDRGRDAVCLRSKLGFRVLGFRFLRVGGGCLCLLQERQAEWQSDRATPTGDHLEHAVKVCQEGLGSMPSTEFLSRSAYGPGNCRCSGSAL